MNPWKFLAACVIGLSSCTADAVVVIADKYQPGDQGVLFDTETGLDWARGPTGLEDGPYEGFRLASPSEVGTLFGDVGLPAESGIYQSYGPPPDYPLIVSSAK